MSLKALAASSAVVAAGFYYQWARSAKVAPHPAPRTPLTDLERQYVQFAASPVTASALCHRLAALLENDFGFRIADPLPSPFLDNAWLNYYTCLHEAKAFHERWRGAQRSDDFLIEWDALFVADPSNPPKGLEDRLMQRAIEHTKYKLLFSQRKARERTPAADTNALLEELVRLRLVTAATSADGVPKDHSLRKFLDAVPAI